VDDLGSSADRPPAAIGLIAVFLPPARWQRVAVTALLVIPLILVVMLSAPAWLVMPFLSEARRRGVIEFLDRLIDWIKAITGVR
jgi:hypothetical protein